MPNIDKIRVNGIDYDLVEDTGWVDLTVLSPATVVPHATIDYTPQARRIGNIIYYHGMVNVSGSGSNVSIVEVPEAFRPGYPCLLWGNAGGNVYYRVSNNTFAMNLDAIGGSASNVRIEGYAIADLIEPEE